MNCLENYKYEEEKCEPKPDADTDEVLLGNVWRIKDALSAARGHSLEKLIADTRERAAKAFQAIASSIFRILPQRLREHKGDVRNEWPRKVELLIN